MEGLKPTLFFRDNEREPSGSFWEPEEKHGTRAESSESILCRQCAHPVTDRQSSCEINDSWDHTFFNPSGIVFQIGCFSWAPGCSIHGQATKEFSWFAGYSWRLALCSNCTSHLGWFFVSHDNSFFGLIVKKLVIP